MSFATSSIETAAKESTDSTACKRLAGAWGASALVAPTESTSAPKKVANCSAVYSDLGLAGGSSSPLSFLHSVFESILINCSLPVGGVEEINWCKILSSHLSHTVFAFM